MAKSKYIHNYNVGSCLNKVYAFTKRSEAKQFIKESGIGLRTYKCNICNLWHLASEK